MRKVLLLAAAVLAAALLWRVVAAWLQTDEARIRDLFATEAERFDDANVLRVLDSFAPDYRDATADLDRPTLRAGLLWLFQNRRVPGSRRFPFRVELGDGYPVTVAGDRATATLPLVLHAGLDDREHVQWELRVEASLERRDGEWVVVRSTHETVAGGPPR